MTKFTNGFVSITRRACSKFALGIFSIFAFTHPASSETDSRITSSEALGLISTVNINVSDDVSDGCWTNASSIEAKLRLLFEQNEIIVEREELAFLTVAARLVFVVATGYRLNGICVASASFELRHWATSSLGGYDNLPEFLTSGLVVSVENGVILANRVNVNQQLQDFVEASAANLVADILSARRSDAVRFFKNTYPRLWTH